MPRKVFFMKPLVDRRKSSSNILFSESLGCSILNSKQEKFHKEVLLPGKSSDFNHCCKSQSQSKGKLRNSVRRYTSIGPWVKEMRRIQLMISACIGFNSSPAYIHLYPSLPLSGHGHTYSVLGRWGRREKASIAPRPRNRELTLPRVCRLGQIHHLILQ